MAQQQTYEYNVDMTCEGCSNAVNRVLGKLQDVSNVKIDLPNKKVFVTTSSSGSEQLGHEQVLEAIKKTGKGCTFVGIQK